MKISDAGILKAALQLQRNEITEYHVYSKLSGLCKDPHNAGVLRSVAGAEKDHALFWEEKTGVKVKASVLKIVARVLMARILGLTFTLKRMEKNEGTASKHYMTLVNDFPEVRSFSREEAEHEKALLAMLDEEMLRYAGSIVLGLNDALVELTGALAGFTLALGETRMISLAGLITGISAAFSMGASDYLARRAEGDSRAFKSALYTGGAYIITVALLILPFLLLSEKLHALFITLAVAVGIIFLFNYYLSIARDLDFKRRFAEMTLISLSIAALSFGVGFVLKNLLGV
ncbi:MAG: VIT1/CCC1 family protein [Spirochaetaceae bacterium]|jgi:VIT1/CCC1 family predicted Fe2+/Mn2+ transporter|nr:VIT1/CCC1 family protein [Spirochaetaceae bacterium]